MIHLEKSMNFFYRAAKTDDSIKKPSHAKKP